MNEYHPHAEGPASVALMRSVACAWNPKQVCVVTRLGVVSNEVYRGPGMESDVYYDMET